MGFFLLYKYYFLTIFDTLICYTNFTHIGGSMLKKYNLDIISIVMSLIIGVFIGYIISTKINVEETDQTVLKEQSLEYFYLLQVAKFDNPDGASNYQKVLKTKNLDSVVVYDRVYYYIYGGIGSSEEALADLKSKFYLLGYETIIKKEYLIDKANSVIESNELYEFYTECINNLYKSLNGDTFTISEKYFIDPINIELFTQLSILLNMKNTELKQKAELQAYKIIIENL